MVVSVVRTSWRRLLLAGTALVAAAVFVAPPAAAQTGRPFIVQTNSAGDSVSLIDPVTDRIAAEIPDAEVIHGAIVEKAAPSWDHGHSQITIGGVLGRRFGGRGGGRWPGGWWLGTEVDVEYEPHELFRHDIVGWRRSRAPDRPGRRPVRLRPDWVCEILSPSNEKRDLVDKMQVLRRAALPYYWIVNPEERILIVHRLEAQGYLVTLTAGVDDTVRAEPFDDVEIALAVLFGEADDDA
jgi:Uma2 family endonuclease